MVTHFEQDSSGDQHSEQQEHEDNIEIVELRAKKFILQIVKELKGRVVLALIVNLGKESEVEGQY